MNTFFSHLTTIIISLFLLSTANAVMIAGEQDNSGLQNFKKFLKECDCAVNEKKLIESFQSRVIYGEGEDFESGAYLSVGDRHFVLTDLLLGLRNGYLEQWDDLNQQLKKFKFTPKLDIDGNPVWDRELGKMRMFEVEFPEGELPFYSVVISPNWMMVDEDFILVGNGQQSGDKITDLVDGQMQEVGQEAGLKNPSGSFALATITNVQAPEGYNIGALRFNQNTIFNGVAGEGDLGAMILDRHGNLRGIVTDHVVTPLEFVVDSDRYYERSHSLISLTMNWLLSPVGIISWDPFTLEFVPDEFVGHFDFQDWKDWWTHYKIQLKKEALDPADLEPFADLDNDGFLNIFEYALGSYLNQVLGVDVKGDQILYTTKRFLDPSIEICLEESTDLKNWYRVEGEKTSETPLFSRYAYPKTHPKAFYRLSVKGMKELNQ